MNKIETEKKYIIRKPSYKTVSEQKAFTESEILQIYLESEFVTHRVRRRKFSYGKTEYTENKKVRITPMSSEEYEREISEEEFYSLAKNIEKGASELHKIRLTFEWRGKTFEIDLYEPWKKTCIMEIELECEDEKIVMPPFIEVLSDVTGKREYSNHSMAHKFPEEIIG